MPETKMSFETLAENLKKTGCGHRWTYPVVKMDRAQIRTCCQVSTNEQISNDKMLKHGKDVFLNSDYLIDRKLEMLNGVQHPDCGPCWMLEKDNFPSMRATGPQISKILDVMPGGKNHKESYTREDLEQLAKINNPKMLEIQLDNICDLACIYCNPGYSTTWEKKLGYRVDKPSSEEVQKFHTLFWDWYGEHFHSLDGLCIIGGEPLASPQFFPTLKKLNQIHESGKGKINKPQFLSITTNFNTRPEIFQRFLDLLDQLKMHFNLSINGSTEAVGEKAEFIREGLDWNKFNTNARTLASWIKINHRLGHRGRIDFAIHAAQNALSISSLPDLLDWAGKLETEAGVAINLIQNIVSYPPYLSAQSVLPKKYAQYCEDAISVISSHKTSFAYMNGSRWDEYGHFLKNISNGLTAREPDVNQIHEFKRWFSGLTTERQQKFGTLYPDLMEELINK